MKALWRYNTGTQIIKDVEEPMIEAPDEVKIQVTYNTIGIQDMRMSREWDFYAKPGIAGYEMAGVIVELGEEAKAKGLYVGQRVTGTIVEFCGECYYCKKGEENHCVNLEIHSGTLCDYAIWKAEQVIPIPESISFSKGILIEPVAVVLMAAKRLVMKKEDRICIFGADFNGLVLLQLAKLQGVKEIVVIEPKALNREMAKDLGASQVVDPDDDFYVTKLMSSTDFIGFHSVIITSSSNPEWISSAIDLTAANGILMLTIYYDYNRDISINSAKLFRTGIKLTSSLLYTKSILEEAASIVGELELDSLIVEEYSFEEVLDAFDSEKKNRYPRIGVRGNEFIE